MQRKILANARKNKNDDFYTQLYDIENELKHYKEHFKNKTVYCNCDDPDYSNFYFFFREQFQWYGLKKLITTHYNSGGGCSYKIEITYKDKTIQELKVPLKENGDFRSQECVELLKESDIVVTNPPFSLFREFVEQLIEYNKKFLIIGTLNAIVYKNIFKLIKDNKIWLGYGFKSGASKFIDCNDKNLTINDKKEMVKNKSNLKSFGNIHWFTNLEHSKRNEELILWKTYNPNEFPKYSNFDAINIDKVVEIPKDYKWLMGVPISFLDKYNPNQFEIICQQNENEEYKLKFQDSLEIIDEYNKPTNKQIKTKGVLFLPFLKTNKKIKRYMDNKNNMYYAPYKRIIIKNKMLNK